MGKFKQKKILIIISLIIISSIVGYIFFMSQQYRIIGSIEISNVKIINYENNKQILSFWNRAYYANGGFEIKVKVIGSELSKKCRFSDEIKIESVSNADHPFNKSDNGVIKDTEIIKDIIYVETPYLLNGEYKVTVTGYYEDPKTNKDKNNFYTVSNVFTIENGYSSMEEALADVEKYFEELRIIAEQERIALEAEKEQERIALEAEKAKKKTEGVRIGMTKQDVLDSNWGKPIDINKTITVYGTHEQWCYNGYNYLYFEDGILTSISN